jgi:hypothetical protein
VRGRGHTKDLGAFSKGKQAKARKGRKLQEGHKSQGGRKSQGNSKAKLKKELAIVSGSFVLFPCCYFSLRSP